MMSWKELPTGDTMKVKGVLAAEWKAADAETQRKAVQHFKERFTKDDAKERLNHHHLRNYSCFLNKDGQHVFHFSEWTDEISLDRFVCNDSLFSTSQVQQDLLVTSLWKNVYYPYQLHKESGKSIQNTGLVVFVKQYFKEQTQARAWIDTILETLLKEGNHEGLIQNTYYLDKKGTALLNYALWENEDSYNAFLQHRFPETKMNWEGIQNFKGRLSEKGVIRRHDEFINIYNQMGVVPD